jgi:16S rRNA G527 N7-methylase RsmG
MNPARIAELLAPFLGNACHLTANDIDHISTYIDILLRWNARINLTAVRDPDDMVTRHFGESLFAARILFPKRNQVGTAALGCPDELRSAERREGHDFRHNGNTREQEDSSEGGRAALHRRAVREKTSEAQTPGPTHADIGSGAGFPGIPIKLWRPELALTLIESNQNKATFLREVARTLTLTNINVLAARAETLSKTTFDVVTLRAVERFESILPVAARLVSAGGRLALLIGSAQLPIAASILDHIRGFAADQLTAEPIPLSGARIVVVAKRVASP